jgi:putative transposase
LAHTFSKNYVHAIFATKGRLKIIDGDFQPRLWAYLAGIAKNHDINMLAVGGTEDHIHLLFHLPPKLALAKAVLLLKANSSQMDRQELLMAAGVWRLQREFIKR